MTEMDDEPGFTVTLEEDEGLVPHEVEICPGCGRPRERWSEAGRGYDAGADGRFCCVGCYQETGCTCGG